MWALVCIVFLAFVPGQAIAMNNTETATVMISFFNLGLGTYALTQRGWIVGIFQIAIGLLGLALTASGNMQGGLLDRMDK